jgi:enoyl-CoA hydratase/carnithine racemase
MSLVTQSLVTHTLSAQGIATITLNDAERLNAMSDEMASSFADTVRTLRGAQPLRAVILTGAGKAFSAGGDLGMLDQKRSLTGEANRLAMHTFYDSFLSLLTLKVPLIAAINGAAIGAGLCLACACDIRVASDTAKLGFTFLKLGLHPGMGATFLVPRIIGRSRATELLLSARILSAHDALNIGLVSRVCAANQVNATAHEIAVEILSSGPEASAQLLETMRADLHQLPAALEREALCQSINYVSTEFAEGIAAVREKRVPRF